MNPKSKFVGRTGTVDADSVDGWAQVSLNDDAVPHSFRIEEFELIA
jgi:hypothetical protein